MRPLFLLITLFLFSCSNPPDKKTTTAVTEKEILDECDHIFSTMGNPDAKYKEGNDVWYMFLMDLEHGYFHTAGSRIHLYANDTNWAIVFEKNGYSNRGMVIEIELDFVGNCITYDIEKRDGRNYISNMESVVLIDGDELDRIENKAGNDEETFELIGNDIKTVYVRGDAIPFENDYTAFEKAGVKVRDFDNPKKLASFEDLACYLHATNPVTLKAREDDIRKYIPKDLPKLMTIDEFHHTTVYGDIRPSQQETYKLIAKVLATRDTGNWKPTQKPNNHWSNWKSGHL